MRLLTPIFVISIVAAAVLGSTKVSSSRDRVCLREPRVVAVEIGKMDMDGGHAIRERGEEVSVQLKAVVNQEEMNPSDHCDIIVEGFIQILP